MSTIDTPTTVSGEDKSALGTTRHATQRRVMGATGLMMAGILLSRLLGLFRERVIAQHFGQGFSTDVYNGAFTIPDLLFFLIAGGALSSAFIPVFSEYIATNREKEAWRIFSVVASVMTVVVVGFIIIGEIFTRPLVDLTNPGYSLIPGKIEATIALTRILLPAQVCFFLGGLMMGTLTARNLFAGQAFGPVIYNLGIIFGGEFLVRYNGVAGLCYGAVIGAIVGNLILQWVLVRRAGGYFVTKGLRKHLKHPGVIQVWKLMLPVILGLSLPQVSTIIGKGFASSLGDGPQSAMMYANRLMQVPLGVFAQATAIAIFPTMAAQAARKEMVELRQSLSFGIRSILFLTVPASGLMIVLSMPIVQLILQSGKFQTADAKTTADVLCYFAIGIFAWSAHSIITRGFYALQDSRTPVIVGTAVTLLFIPLNWPLRAWLQVSGLALATSIAATVHMFTMLFLLRKRLNGIDGGRLLISTIKILISTGVSVLACYMIRNAMQRHFNHGHLLNKLGQVNITRESAAILGSALLISALVYLGMALLLRMDEVQVLRKLARK